MAERVVYPPDWWIRAYLAGSASVLFQPMKPQPPGRIVGVSLRHKRKYHYINWHWGGMIEHTHTLAPFAPGDTLLVKETYATAWWAGAPERQYYYRADGDKPNDIPWHSPVTMPREAVRIKPVVMSVAAQWMPDIDDAMAVDAGIEYEPVCGDLVYGPYNYPVPKNTKVGCFKYQWESRYGSRYPWDTAWAWRVEVRHA